MASMVKSGQVTDLHPNENQLIFLRVKGAVAIFLKREVEKNPMNWM